MKDLQELFDNFDSDRDLRPYMEEAWIRIGESAAKDALNQRDILIAASVLAEGIAEAYITAYHRWLSEHQYFLVSKN